MHLAARRAREINSYYHSLGEGLGQFTPPLIESSSNKPLSIALEEIAGEKIVVQHASDARRVAEELLASEGGDADIVTFDPSGAQATAEDEDAGIVGSDEGAEAPEVGTDLGGDEAVAAAGATTDLEDLVRDVPDVDVDADADDATDDLTAEDPDDVTPHAIDDATADEAPPADDK